nr:unnamed protein product [Callosobruchus chinensis]
MAAVIPAVTRLSNRIIRVLGCNPGPMTLQGTNTYIVGTGKRRVLIDTGDADVPQYIHHLKTVLEEEEVNLDHILISHWHHDHLDGVSDIYSQVSERIGKCKVWKFRSQMVQTANIPDDIPLQPLKDEQVFEMEGATLKVLFTPGHTDDHVIFHLLEENAVFSGDCVLGEGTANPKEKIQFYIQHRMERERQIMEVLNKYPMKQFTEEDIVEAVYIDLSEKLIPAACRNVNHHLMKLLRERSVEQVDNKWQIKQ